MLPATRANCLRLTEARLESPLCRIDHCTTYKLYSEGSLEEGLTVALTDLELNRNPPVSASKMLELKLCVPPCLAS